MKIIRNSCLVVLLTILLSCAGTSKTTSKSGDTAKETGKAEDLSAFRPKFPPPPADAGTNASTESMVVVVPTNHVNNRVLTLLDTVANANKGIKYAQGYRILAYTGTERKIAMDIRTAITGRIPEERDYLQYRQPTFRLKIGDYLSRVDAQQVLSQIKDISPNALIISDKININR